MEPQTSAVGFPDYWEARARRFAADGAGLAAVCSFGMPYFYNRTIDLCQRLLSAARAPDQLIVGAAEQHFERRSNHRVVVGKKYTRH